MFLISPALVVSALQLLKMLLEGADIANKVGSKKGSEDRNKHRR